MDLDKAKTLAGVGSALSIFGLGGIGHALVLAGVYDLGNYYNNEGIKRNALWWFIWWFIGMAAATYIITTIAYIAIQEIMLFILFMLGYIKFVMAPTFDFLTDAIIAGAIAVLIIVEIFYVLSAGHLKGVYAALAEASGVKLFNTAAEFYWWGSLLIVILIGIILVWISWIISAVAFFSVRRRS